MKRYKTFFAVWFSSNKILKVNALNNHSYCHVLASIQALQRKDKGFERDLADLGVCIALEYEVDLLL